MDFNYYYGMNNGNYSYISRQNNGLRGNQTDNKNSDNPFMQKKSKDYILGELDDETRIIDKDNVRDIPFGWSTRKDSSIYLRPIYDTNSCRVNGHIDNFMQGTNGDCYLLASINSIKQTKNGEKILTDNIKYNKDGSITVTLPGAVKAKNFYNEGGIDKECAISGVYTITNEALQQALNNAGKSYSYGDIDVIALELAMESYRAEVMKTNRNLHNFSPNKYIPGQATGIYSENPLRGGLTYDATYILTGKQSELYSNFDKKVRLYQQGEFGYVSDNKQKGIGASYFNRYNPEKSVTVIYDKDSDLQMMLDKYKGETDKYAITVGVKVAKNGPDGTTMAGGGHALSVVGITDDYVDVVNPWDTSKKERIPRDIFEQMAIQFSVAEI